MLVISGFDEGELQLWEQYSEWAEVGPQEGKTHE